MDSNLEAGVAEQFTSLFLAARRESTLERDGLKPGSAMRDAAKDFALKADIPGAVELLEVSALERKGERTVALSRLEQVANTLPDSLRPLERFLTATVYHGLEQYDEALKAYAEAGADQGLIPKGFLSGNVGAALAGLQKYDEALRAYEDALTDPRIVTPGALWFGIGNVLALQGRYEEAITAYKNVLADPQNQLPVMSWMEIGRMHANLGQRDEARAALLKALEHPDPRKTEHALAQAVLELIDADLDLDALSEGDLALLQPGPKSGETPDPEQRMLRKVQSAKQTQYDSYLQRNSSDRDNVLSILRGWSSAVTLLEGSERLWRGGGYLVKWMGVGIVIDPGFDFLRNLHDAGYHGREIDAVVVSHNHPDHNSDLQSIDDLRYELYKRRSRDLNGGVKPYVLIWDRATDAATSFSAQRPEHQRHPIGFDIGRCTPTDTVARPHGLPFSITYFEVRHGELRDAVGFRLALHADGKSDFIIGYTGDTEFFPDLAERLKECDVLIAHISQPDEKEFTDPKFRKQVHLGYRGLADLVHSAQPKLTLVGEFWAGLADLRIDLVQGLRRLSGTDAILPTGLGMHVSLPSTQIECTECNGSTRFESVKVAPPPTRYGNLSYLCPSCLLG